MAGLIAVIEYAYSNGVRITAITVDPGTMKKIVDELTVQNGKAPDEPLYVYTRYGQIEICSSIKN